MYSGTIASVSWLFQSCRGGLPCQGLGASRGVRDAREFLPARLISSQISEFKPSVGNQDTAPDHVIASLIPILAGIPRAIFSPISPFVQQGKQNMWMEPKL